MKQPAQLVAALVTQAMPSTDLFDVFRYNHGLDEEEVPVALVVWKILKGNNGDLNAEYLCYY